jgi:hypothetical protein
MLAAASSDSQTPRAPPTVAGTGTGALVGALLALVDESSLVVGMVVVGVSVVAATGTGALVGELLVGVRVVSDAASKV